MAFQKLKYGSESLKIAQKPKFNQDFRHRGWVVQNISIEWNQQRVLE